jgi:hypothetical protein
MKEVMFILNIVKASARNYWTTFVVLRNGIYCFHLRSRCCQSWRELWVHALVHLFTGVRLVSLSLQADEKR